MSTNDQSTQQTQDSDVSMNEMRKVFDIMKPSDVAALPEDIETAADPHYLSKMLWLQRSYHKWSTKMISTTKVALFYAHNDIEASTLIKESHGSANSREVFTAMMEKLQSADGTLNHLCLAQDCSLQVYELDPDHPTTYDGDTPSMSEQECGMALTYGMMSVEQQTDCLLTAAFGAHTNDVALALADTSIAADKKGFDRLMHMGNREIAAMCGAVIAARLAGIPCIIEGATALAALTILEQEHPNSITHCLIADSEQWDMNKSMASWSCFQERALAPHSIFGANMIQHYAQIKNSAALLYAINKSS